MLRIKAKKITNELWINDFQFCNGCLAVFPIRNNLKFCVLCSESASADSNVTEDWKTKLSEIFKEYSAENPFNADETGFFKIDICP